MADSPPKFRSTIPNPGMHSTVTRSSVSDWSVGRVIASFGGPQPLSAGSTSLEVVRVDFGAALARGFSRDFSGLRRAKISCREFDFSRSLDITW